MSNYIPVQVSHKRQKQLADEASGSIFWRQDSGGLYWVKAADKYGEQKMNSYGLNARE